MSDLEKEIQRLKRLLENHKEFLNKKDNDIEELKKENLQLKTKNDNFYKERRTLEICIEERNKTISSLEKEVVSRTLKDLKDGVKAKREKGEVVYKDELALEWYKLFLEMPNQTRNRITVEAEKMFDNKQANIPAIREYLMKEVYIPRVLYEKGFFPICEASRKGKVKAKVNRLKVIRDNLKNELIKTENELKELQPNIDDSDFWAYCETAAKSHEGIE